MGIKKNLTTVNYKKVSNRQIKYIVIHYTANNGDTAKGNTNYFKSVYRGASAHYFVDGNEIWQSIEDENEAWHCGTKGTYYHKYCRNSNSIGIEMCSMKDKNGAYYIKNEVVENTVQLTKELMRKYNIPVENVLRHYDVTHKRCPEPFVRNNQLWVDFKNKLVESEENVMFDELLKEGYTKEQIKAAIIKMIKATEGGEETSLKDYVDYCRENGIMNGYTDKTFKPSNFITRAEVAVVATKLHKQIK